MYNKTEHARRRCQQRAIPRDAIEAALDYGRVYRQPGRLVYFLGRRQVALQLQRGLDLRRHINTAVVVAKDNAILTTIHTQRTHKLRKKRLKYRLLPCQVLP